MPIITLYASLLGLLLIYLSLRVVRQRKSDKVDIGSGEGMLKRYVRAQANFTEYVPIALILLVLLAYSGAANWLLHILGSLLVIARLLHAFGFVNQIGVSFGRVAGTALTWGVIVISALVNLYCLLIH